MTQNPAKRKCPSFGPANVTCVGKTDIEHDKCSILWTVTNYSVVRGIEELKSPVFRGVKTNHGWQLKLNPKSNVGGVKCLSLYLILVNSRGDKRWLDWMSRSRPVQAKFRFGILNAQGQLTEEVINNDDVVEFKVSEGWGVMNLVSCSDLFTKNLVIDNKLKIYCQVEILGELKNEVSNGGLAKANLSEEEERKNRRKSEALDDFGKMFRESIATDVTISTGITSFKAHKAVLSARSSVFAAMFNPNVMGMLDIVEIKDFDDKVVQGMLEYLYTGQTDYLPERATELLQIAEKYNLVGLKEDCQHVINRKKADEEKEGNDLEENSVSKSPLLEATQCRFIKPNQRCKILKGSTVQDAGKGDSCSSTG